MGFPIMPRGWAGWLGQYSIREDILNHWSGGLCSIAKTRATTDICTSLFQASKGHCRNVELESSFSLIYHVHFDKVEEEMTMQNPATPRRLLYLYISKPFVPMPSYQSL